MTTRTREAAYAALWALGSGAYAFATKPPRGTKFVLWNDVPPEACPAFYQFEGGDNEYQWGNGALPRRGLVATWFIYLNAMGAQQSGLTNTIMDALDAALKANPVTGKCDLGGACDHVRITGPVMSEPGDLDGDGMIIVPLQIILP